MSNPKPEIIKFIEDQITKYAIILNGKVYFTTNFTDLTQKKYSDEEAKKLILLKLGTE